MNAITVLHIAALAACLVLGSMVFLSNTRRTANQIFAVLSAVLAVWMICMAATFRDLRIETITACVRGCNIVAVMLPICFDWLRMAIVTPTRSLSELIRCRAWHLGLALVVMGLCLTTYFLRGVDLVTDHVSLNRVIAEPHYGMGIIAYGAYQALWFAWLGSVFIRDLRRTHGIQHAELQFVVFASLLGTLWAILTTIVIPLITHTSQSVQFTPFSVVTLYTIIAYGIATRQFMSVAHVLRLSTAYALLTVYLVVVYVGTLWLAHVLVANLSGAPVTLPYLLAALTVAFSMAPAHGWMQRFAGRLFLPIVPTDMESTVGAVTALLQSIGTVDRLLADFSRATAAALDAATIRILIEENGAYVERNSAVPNLAGLRLEHGAPAARELAEGDGLLVPGLVRRRRVGATLAAACAWMDDVKAAVAVGIPSKRALSGVILFGPRLSGRIYGVQEQRMLRLFGNQLGVALENAVLYTQVQDSKIYNDILVDNLTSGVVAVNMAGQVTVFNREARRVTRLTGETVLGQPLRVLHGPLATLLEQTLRGHLGAHDVNLAVRFGDETVPLLASSAILHGHTGQLLGALLVFNDLTAIRKLEMQVRRSDRLASIGTLSAGMAHEIRNPLTTIQTFTDLLPERYDDPDFRQTFFSLVGQEVRRIESIVTQLLQFSRPAPPSLAPTHLPALLDNTLALFSQRMRLANVEIRRVSEAGADLVSADASLLKQALFNILLNALDAMPGGGALTVSLRNLPLDSPIETADAEGGRIEIAIQDTGEGIPADRLGHIFDPFFTTKSNGTGLGLSIAHGIVSDHGGTIEVESEPGHGTVFRMILPVAGKQEGAA